MDEQTEIPSFANLVNLTAARLGGEALLANDEFFAAKENLLKPGRGVFIPDKFTERGKWMDGWETRRRRTPGHDWCIIKLGLPGTIRGVDVDTNHFLGNHPAHVALDACRLPSNTIVERAEWTEILPKSPLESGSQNFFALADENCWSHVRLNIYPDGGVARLRVYGEVVPDWSQFGADAVIDLAAVENGGLACVCSDRFFSPMNNLLLPGPSLNMGDGWETRRRRGPGHDWVIVKLGTPGLVHQVEVDTTFFRGNYPDRCSLEGCYFPASTLGSFDPADAEWRELLPSTKLEAHHQHLFAEELHAVGPCSHVRLNIYPDGGVARLRVFGTRYFGDDI